MSRLADTPLLRTLAIYTDKIQIPIYRGLTKNDSKYYGLLLFRTQNDFPKVSATKGVPIIYILFLDVARALRNCFAQEG